MFIVFFFKQKTAYEMRISDWSSDVCSSDLEVPCATVFLVGNVGFANPRGHSLVLFLYWFVEICIQLMLIWTAPFLVPAVRRWPSRDAFVFGLAFLAAAMAARFAMPQIGRAHV